MSRGLLRIALFATIIVTAACGGGGGSGGGGQGLASIRPATSETTTTSIDQGTTTSSIQRPTTTQRTTTTESSTTSTTTTTTTTSTTTPTTQRPTTTERPTTTRQPTTTQQTGTTQGALPPTTAATVTPATTPASTSEQGDTGWWWLLLLVVIVAGLLVWLITRPKKKPIDERWRTQAEQLATDMDSVSHLLLAGADAGGAIADDRWTGVLSRSHELRRLAANVAAAAETVELRDAITGPTDALRSLELSADAARLHVVGAADQARADADRVAAGLLNLRQQVSPTAANVDD